MFIIQPTGTLGLVLVVREDAGTRANRKAKEATAKSKARREGTNERARSRASELKGSKSLLKKLFGG